MQKLICINFKGGANDMESTKLIIFKQIGAKIAYYRTLRGLTQAQLAEIINVSPDTLGRVERGKYNNNISISMLLDIAMGLNIELATLVTFTEQDREMWPTSK
jgi:hypothetical protein